MAIDSERPGSDTVGRQAAASRLRRQEWRRLHFPRKRHRQEIKVCRTLLEAHWTAALPPVLYVLHRLAPGDGRAQLGGRRRHPLARKSRRTLPSPDSFASVTHGYFWPLFAEPFQYYTHASPRAHTPITVPGDNDSRRTHRVLEKRPIIKPMQLLGEWHRATKTNIEFQCLYS